MAFDEYVLYESFGSSRARPRTGPLHPYPMKLTNSRFPLARSDCRTLLISRLAISEIFTIPQFLLNNRSRLAGYCHSAVAIPAGNGPALSTVHNNGFNREMIPKNRPVQKQDRPEMFSPPAIITSLRRDYQILSVPRAAAARRR